MRAVIFANGTLSHPQATRDAIHPGDLIIAADGGARHCLDLGITPAVLIGDCDSLSQGDQERLQTAGAQVVRHPRRKDQTDLELAVDYARQVGADEVIILGGVGSRWDQSLANLLLLTAEPFASMQIQLRDGPQSARLLRGGQTITLRGEHGDTVSLIALSAQARGVTTHGLEYSLHNGTLELGSTLGISNSLIAEQAFISLQEGLLLCLMIHGPLAAFESLQENPPAAGP